MADCLFCKIIAGEIPSTKVYEDGEMLGVEVKAGGMVGQDDFKHLKWFAANLAKSRFTGVVLYAGPDVLRFGEGFYAVPLAALGA